MQQSKPPKSISVQLIMGIGILLGTFAAPAIGFFSPPTEWYQQINKPNWNPPAWIFGPVWSSLYLMMATAAFLVWRVDGWSRAMTAYLVQLIFNAAWTPLFFGAQRIDWACTDILALWFSILITLILFHRVHRIAAWLIIPYLGWVSFATVLNATLWAMNR